MIRHKWIGAFAALLMALAVLALGFAYLNPSVITTVTASREPKYVAAMDKTEIMDIEIIADENEWANMLTNATQEEYIPATVVINGIKVSNVGIRPKGNSSLSMVAQDSTTDRYSFKIEFDHYVAGQTWLGLDKLVINNMQGDATYMKEYLSYDIMDYAGVEAPLYAFADISLNGEKWGFYLAVEALDDGYAKRVYGNDHGKLYKPESMGMRGAGRMNEFLENMQGDNAGGMGPWGERQQGEQTENTQSSGELAEQPREQSLEHRVGGGPGGFGGMGGMSSNGISLQYTDDDISSYSAIFENAVFKSNENDYRRVVKSLEKLSKGEDLNEVVDVEAVLKYFAAHTVVVNLDSYVSNMGHNYYLYEEAGKLSILPWDYNLAFGGFQAGDASSVVNFPIDTPVSGVSLSDRPLLGKLLEVPEYLDMYHDYLREIVEGYFNSGLFEATVDAMDALIATYVESDPTAFYEYEAYKAAIPQLKTLGMLRAESIEGQLGGEISSTSEGQSAEPGKIVDTAGIDISVLGSQGGGGNRNGGGPGFFGGRQGQGGAMGILPEGMELGDMENNMGQGENFPQPPENMEWGGQPSYEATGYDTDTWILLSASALLLLLGLLFALLYKRRRMA